MSKKKKSSEKQEYFAKQRKEQRKAAEKAKKRKRLRRKVICIAVCCAAAAGIIIGCTVWTVNAKPFTHLIPVVKTEHYSLNAAEVSFYAWQIYDNYMDNASDSSEMPDTEVPLSKQNYDDETTWEEYFTDAAVEYAKNVLTYCEASYAAGYEPDNNLESLAATALEQMDPEELPSFVSEEDAKHALELYCRAQYYNEDAQNDFAITEEDMLAYYEEDPKTMQACDYMQFAFAFDDSSETALTESEASDLARDLQRCNTKEEFEEWVYSYYQENTTLSEDELKTQIQTLYVEEFPYMENDTVSAWAFSGDAAVGDTTTITDTENGNISVYLLVSEPYRDDTYPVNVRQIILTSSTYESTDGAHEAAEQVLAEWESSDQTEDTFASLADQYTEDTSVSGGLYENITKYQLMTNWRDWYFDESRQPGDVTILDSSYGSCIAYFSGTSSQMGWEMTAYDALYADRYQEFQDNCNEQADCKTTDWMKRFLSVKAD